MSYFCNLQQEMCMNSGFRKILTLLASLCLAINMPARDIPVLSEDPAVLKGALPNGMAYYLVSNPASKGQASFALVQKTGLLTVQASYGEKVMRTAQESLDTLKRTCPSGFLSRHGVVPGRNGLFRVTDDATVFRFPDIRLDMGKNVLDSTILVILDIADRTDGDDFMKKWYSVADQAVVVSGDINPKTVEEKLRNMALMIPEGKSFPRPEYVRESCLEPVSIERTAADSSMVRVSATWTSQRPPRGYMNTIQTEMFEMSLNTLGSAAEAGIRRVLKSRGVPFADVSYRHLCSSSYPYDDTFTIRAVVAEGDASKALEAIAGVMSSIGAAGLGPDEYLMAESSYIRGLAYEAGRTVKSNDEYIERCVNAFLYNSSLASPKERLEFHTSRNLPDTLRLRLFNDVAGAFLDQPVFETAWTSELPVPELSMNVNMADTSGFPGAGLKMKLKSSKKEHVSGGSIWTFSNGFKVIYKKMASDRMYYSLALNGGYGSMEGLEAGEGAFLSDYPDICRINGLETGDFMDILKMEGMTMDFKVNMSNTKVSGSVPYDRMRLLLRSLLAVTNRMTPDEEALDYWKNCEYMALDMAKGGFVARMTAIDSIICPDYKYSPYKVKGRISEDFIRKADGFFKDRFSRMNDGALILVGNMDETRLKKLLMEYVGNFRTTNVAFRRPVVRYQPVSGWSTYTVEGSSDNLDVVLSSRLPLTMENYIAANLASMVLERNVAKVLEDSGMYFTVVGECRIYPEERFNMCISVSEIASDGGSYGRRHETPIGALGDVRSALADLHVKELAAEELKPYKESLKNSLALAMKGPEYWVHAISLRYLDGKNFTTDYAAKIDAVTPERVKSVFKLLNDGCKVEYVTNKKQIYVSRNYNSD